MCLEDYVEKKCICCGRKTKVSSMVDEICSADCLHSYVTILKNQLNNYIESRDKLENALTNSKEQSYIVEKIKNYNYEIEITENILKKLSEETYPKDWGITKDVASSFINM